MSLSVGLKRGCIAFVYCIFESKIGLNWNWGVMGGEGMEKENRYEYDGRRRRGQEEERGI